MNFKIINFPAHKFLHNNSNINIQNIKSTIQIQSNINRVTYVNDTYILLRQVDNTNLQTYVTDANNSVLKLKNFITLTDSQIYSYDAYGNSIAKPNALIVNNPFQYDDIRFDDNTLLKYLKSRFYNSQTKRFLNQDSYDLLNKFSYANLNPISYRDPTGHMIEHETIFKTHKTAFDTQCCVLPPLFNTPLNAFYQSFAGLTAEEIYKDNSVWAYIGNGHCGSVFKHICGNFVAKIYDRQNAINSNKIVQRAYLGKNYESHAERDARIINTRVINIQAGFIAYRASADVLLMPFAEFIDDRSLSVSEMSTYTVGATVSTTAERKRIFMDTCYNVAKYKGILVYSDVDQLCSQVVALNGDLCPKELLSPRSYVFQAVIKHSLSNKTKYIKILRQYKPFVSELAENISDFKS